MGSANSKARWASTAAKAACVAFSFVLICSYSLTGCTTGTEETDGSASSNVSGSESSSDSSQQSPEGENAEEGGNGDAGTTPPEMPEGEGSPGAGGTDGSGSGEDGQTPPEKPDGSDDSGTTGTTPPEKPEGEDSSDADGTDGNTDGEMDGQTPPEKPDGEQTDGDGEGGTPPSMPSDGEEGQAPDGQEGGQAPDGQGGGQAPDGDGQGGGQAPGAGGGGANTQSFDYSGSYTATLVADGEEKDSQDESIEASESLSNAALAQNGGTLNITGGTLKKSGDATDGDSCNFYGVNSILLSVGESSKAVVQDSTLSADSEGSNGIFATDNATVFANSVNISTEAANSRGLDATYGGTVVANKLTIATKGDHSAAFATDRGGGNISVTSSDVSTAGSGSPLIYSTGCIEASDVTGTATGSQIAGMEGLNTIRIYDSNLESTVTDKTASDPVANGVIIYQSTSGDADTSTGETARFEASGSTLKSAIQSGSMFYCTNTQASIVLSDTVLDFDSSSAALVTAAGNDSNNWGSAGSNGAVVSFTGLGETLSGNATADTISSLSMYLLDGTTWTGAAEITENSQGSTVDTPLTVNVDDDSTWVVTGDCTVSALNVEDGGKVVDASGKSVTITAGGTTVVEGESELTVTVTGAYGTDFETSDAQEISATSIDRTQFDEQFGTSTAFGTDGVSIAEGAPSNENANANAGAGEGENSGTGDTDEEGGFLAWLSGVWQSFLGLFS